MELDQIQLIYVNLSLLMLTASIALYLPKKIKQAQNSHGKPKIHPEILKFYRALNEAIKYNQPVLNYIVDPIPSDQFVSFYKGLLEIHGFKVDLHSHRLYDGTQSEFIVVDLKSYQGPRTVEPVFKENNYPYSRQRSVQHPAVHLYREEIRTKSSKPVRSIGNVVSILTHPKHPENNVLDLNSYRKNKQIIYISSDNDEGA